MHRKISYFNSKDGLRIRCARFRNREKATRGTIVYLPGRAEFIEKNEESIQELLARGFEVHTMDWRGQGLSGRLLKDRHKGYVEIFSDYLDDLVCFFDHFLKEVGGPIVLLGHSMGGHIALHYMRAHPARIDRAVLTSPMIDINTSPLPRTLARVIARAAVSIGIGNRYIIGTGRYVPGKRPFANNPLTGDPERFLDELREIEKQPDLALGGATFRWLHAAFDSIALLQEPGFAAAVRTPILMVSGDNDRVVCRAAQKRICQYLPNCRYVEIKGGRHELLKETDAIRQAFWKHFDTFVRG